jgi:hypothetical protein
VRPDPPFSNCDKPPKPWADETPDNANKQTTRIAIAAAANLFNHLIFIRPLYLPIRKFARSTLWPT